MTMKNNGKVRDLVQSFFVDTPKISLYSIINKYVHDYLKSAIINSLEQQYKKTQIPVYF